MYQHREINWALHADEFCCALLLDLGVGIGELEYLDTNPITDALAEGDFVERFGTTTGFSRIAVSRAATICQMAVYDKQGGPEGDNEPKALRRHWYAWYKSAFAQPFADQLGDYKINAQGVKEYDDRAWAGRLSETYAELVDTGDITYLDLWVDDASRMIEGRFSRLFRDCHVIVCVEKDSLFSDFVAPAKALGATAVYSGKGKSSKAAIEKVLREQFDWTRDYQPFADDAPLVILHVSDYDYDGEAVIGPTFAQQASRYSSHIVECQVGVYPQQVQADGTWTDPRYALSCLAWAEEKALFVANCDAREGGCGTWIVRAGAGAFDCPQCGALIPAINVTESTPHGFEVEAMTTRDYRSLLVDALLACLPFEFIVERLRDECQADAYSAASTVASDIFKANEAYTQIDRLFDKLRNAKSAFENDVVETLNDSGSEHVDDWRELEDDPTVTDFKDHVVGADRWAGPWRPFSASARTDELVSWLHENEADAIDEFSTSEIGVDIIDGLIEIRDLARTDLPTAMTAEQWAAHRLARIANIADRILTSD